MGNDMRNLILLGTIIAALTFGSVSAKASGSAAEIAVSSSSGPAVVAAAEMIESGWTSASGLQASAAELQWLGRSLGEDIVIAMRDVTLVVLGALVFGLGAVCARVRRVEAPPRSVSYGRPAAV
jgi:hypothetical protein